MDVKPGYKQTEVGVIPEDWDARSLAEIGQFKTGPFGTSLKASEYYASEGAPLVSVGEIGDGVLIFSEHTPLVPPAVVRRLSQYVLNRGDIVFGRKGGVERSAMVQPDQAGCFLGSDGIRLRTSKESHAPFISYQLQRHEIRTWLLQNATGTTMPSMNQGILRRVFLPHAGEAEQQAIAGALEDVDALLGALDRLIAKKRDLKQAAMQQLLTGQTRLPGFVGNGRFRKTDVGLIPDDWQVAHLVEIVDPSRSIRYGIVQPGEYDPQGRYMIRGQDYSEVNGWAKASEIFRVTPKIEIRYRNARVKAGDLIMTIVGYCGHVETIPDWLEGANITQTTARIAILPKKASSVFCKYILLSPIGGNQVAAYMKGAAQPGLNCGDVEQFQLPLPGAAEQIAIAELLSDMDAELGALEQRRAKTQALKQGMMQELLTGRIRLVETPNNIIALPTAKAAGGETNSHNWQIDEAVIIGALAKQFGTEAWPLPRKRRVKLTYLLHRHAHRSTDAYQKKAAGPYNPKSRYQGPEGIAVKNGYVREHNNGKYPGFVAGEKVAQAEQYFEQWYPGAKQWLEQFRFSKTEELELLATVDMAMEDLRKEGRAIALPQVKQLIQDAPEWKAKLDRDIFSDENIAKTMKTCDGLFQTN